MINSPEELQEQLVAFYPALEKEIEGEGFDYGYKPNLTYHQTWMAFAPIANDCLTKSNSRTLKAFCEIINYMVSEGGDKENSVSTCLLEHASQIKIGKIIKPYLSQGAKSELG